jgi:hypothetical protein
MGRMLFGVLVLVGCAGSPPYGSFLKGRQATEAAMAADAAQKLAADYGAPARSIWLSEEATDAFGRSLSTELRKAGFRVRSGAAPKEKIDLAVRYVADVLKGTELCRLTVYVDRRSLSRAYLERGSRVYPAGPWSAEASAEARGGR